ncbi:MAG: M20/M25/M40 family metallo-hydrolase [Pyrinomonadaceae bacterium]
MKRNLLLHLTLIFAVAFSAIAQQQRASAPGAERLREHVTYLASDKLEGRRTGTQGAQDAAVYIAGEFSRYGLKRSAGVDLPGMSILEANSPNRYMQPFPYVAGVEVGKNNAMWFTPNAAAVNTPVSASVPVAAQGKSASSLDLRAGEDWMPLGFSTNAEVLNGAAAFVGYGITASELKYDDYAGVDAAGRIAIAFADTPDGDNPHGEFARYADSRWKAVAARDHHAKALVIIAREDNFKDDRLSRLRYDNSAGDAGLPVVVISRQVAAKLFELESTAKLDDFEKKLREGITTARSLSKGTQQNITLKMKPPLNFTLSLKTDIVRRETPANNVIGILNGSDPKLKDEVIVIGAHYDHLGLGGEGSLAAREGEIHHGADDNASGVAGLLELARIFSAERGKLRRTLVFIAFSGEEEGLLGSNFYVNHPVVPLAQTVAMINMDMIGRMKARKLIVGGMGTAQEWKAWIEKENTTMHADLKVSDRPSKTLPYVVKSKGQNANAANTPPAQYGNMMHRFDLTLNEDGYGPSDHSSFYAKQVPVLFFWTGTHDDYHKPSDTADKINYEDEAHIITFIADILRFEIDANDARPTYTTAKSESTGRSMGFRVYLGTIPNYADSNDGLKLDGVRDDSPASKAGLKAGDKIVRMAGRDVRNVYDYTYALGEMKAGQEYEVEIVRGSEHLTLKITPAARK